MAHALVEDLVCLEDGHFRAERVVLVVGARFGAVVVVVGVVLVHVQVHHAIAVHVDGVDAGEHDVACARPEPHLVLRVYRPLSAHVAHHIVLYLTLRIT